MGGCKSKTEAFKVSFQALRKRLEDKRLEVVKTGPCYVSSGTNLPENDPQRFAILVKDTENSIYSVFHFAFEPFKGIDTKALQNKTDLDRLDAVEGNAFVFSKQSVPSSIKRFRVKANGEPVALDIRDLARGGNIRNDEDWGSPIHLTNVLRIVPKGDANPTEEQYFRVKAVEREEISRSSGNSPLRINTVFGEKDTMPWTKELVKYRAQWGKSLQRAFLNSPDVNIARTFVDSLLPKPKPDRRLACEVSPLADFLSILAILLPILFLIYWMFLRRIYYPKRNQPTIRKTFRSNSEFRTAP